MQYPTLKADALAAKKRLKANGHKFVSLLSKPTDNPKLAKSAKLNVLSSPLHLAPAELSGFNVCPMSSAGCRAACLHTAGNPAFMSAKASSRIDRTKAYFNHRPDFMLVLAYEIAKLEKTARATGKIPAVRLNATSDIPWENVHVQLGRHRFANLMEMFPGCTYYDYTKRSNRKKLPVNYSLTFSLAEDNDRKAIEAHKNGMNIAAVFDTKRTKDLPATYQIAGTTIAVIDGDEHDYRPADIKGVIVGLRAKGDARKDTSGFVRKVAPATLIEAAQAMGKLEIVTVR